MNNFYSILTKLYELFFPVDPKILLSENVTITALQKTAKRTHAELPQHFFAPFSYKDKLIHNLIHTAKYYNHTRSAHTLGEILAPLLAEELGDKHMFEEFTEAILVPVPLHAKKLAERGFNQTERIAQALVHNLETNTITLDTSLLTRVVYSAPQAHQKNREARIQNMRDAFTASTEAKGKDIVLLDDVVTTGATLTSAKKTLINAGARNVLCVAIAH